MIRFFVYQFLLLFLFSASLLAQDEWHWTEVLNTPGTSASIRYYFSDGGLLAHVNASNKIAISDDKGATWRFGEPGGFLDASFSSYEEDLNGNFYFTNDYSRNFYRIDRSTMEIKLVHESSDQVFSYAADEDHLYLIIHNEIRKVNIINGGIVGSYFSTMGNFDYINVSKNNEILALTKSGNSLVLDENLEEQTIVMGNQISDVEDRNINIYNQLMRVEDDGFSISEDYGANWYKVDIEGVWEYDQYLGNEEYYATVDSFLYVYDVKQKVWKDTIYSNTFIQIQGATDRVYFFPNSNSYPWAIHYLTNEGEYQVINEKIGPPNVTSLIALNDSTFYIPNGSLLYHNAQFSQVEDFDKIVQLSSGEIIATTYDSLYISVGGDDSFVTMPAPVSVRDGVTKDEGDRLFLFRYNGIWISVDKGETWTHDCPPAYFPAFDVQERTIQPLASNIYYGFTSLNSVLRYNHNTDIVNIGVQNSNSDKFRIEQFFVTSDGIIYYTYLVKATGIRTFKIRMGNQTTTLEIPPFSIAGTFAVDPDGSIFIHDGASIYKSDDKGLSWMDITSNLPESLTINMISVAADKTVYLGCKNGNIFKSGKEKPSGYFSEIVPTRLQIFPNPVSDYLYIKDTGNANGNSKNYSIYDVHGRKHKAIFQVNSETRVFVQDIQPGVYFLQEDNSRRTARFIIAPRQ